MINGPLGIFTFGPAFLAGLSSWPVHVPPLHWRWLFWMNHAALIFTNPEPPKDWK